MKPLKAAFLSLALTTTMGVMAVPAMADTSAIDPTQVTKLVSDIEAAINALPAGSSVLTIEGAINTAIGLDGFSADVNGAALKVAGIGQWQWQPASGWRRRRIADRRPGHGQLRQLGLRSAVKNNVIAPPA